MMKGTTTVGLGAAAVFLALATTDAFNLPRAPEVISRKSISSVNYSPHPAFSISTKNTALRVLSDDQTLHTAERLSGMSRGEIQHIFEDVDADGSGAIDVAELDLLAKYFPGETFNSDLRKRLMAGIDTDGNGLIDAEEFYQWMVVNAKSGGSADEMGTKKMQMRMDRLEVGREGISDHLMELLVEVDYIIVHE